MSTVVHASQADRPPGTQADRLPGTGVASLPAGLGPEVFAELAQGVAAAPDADRLPVTAPFTGGWLADLPCSTPEDVTAAYAAARSAQVAWAARPPAQRARVLRRYHDLVLDHQQQILDLVQAETGKARRHAFEEVADVAVTAAYYGRRGPGLLRSRRRAGAYPLLTQVVEHRQPKGVVGVVSPWNYPFTLAMGDGLAALLAGNAVVHKPDLQSAFTALYGVRLLHEAGLPADLWQVVVGDGPVVGGAVVDGADYVCFTGSTAVGREVAARCGARLVGCSLELGGKNALLVLDDADLNRAAEGAVRACFASAGQLCISAERLYVAASVYEPFLARFLDRVRRMRLAATYDYRADMGSLVSARQLTRVQQHVADAVAQGARVLAGGKLRPDIGPLFFEPTVLADVRPGMRCHAEETFGPVVSVYAVGSEDEAVARANDTTYGLNASVWTRNAARGRSVAARLRAGTVNVNEGYAAAWGSVDAPMGGMGDSGLGRRHGTEGLLKYTEAQTVAVQRGLGFGTPPGMTAEQFARTLTVLLRTMKRLGLR